MPGLLFSSKRGRAMTDHTKLQNENEPAEYQKPELIRWGTLRELTLGGGGNKNEPATKSKTRF